MTGRPADACPYPKPFRADFNECPSYQTRHAIVLDSTNRPLRTIWSCRHMETKQVPGQSGHYYGACQLGDAKGREDWVKRIGPDRIRSIRKLRTQVMPIAQAFVDEMAGLMGRQVDAAREGRDPELVRSEMRELGGQYLAELSSTLQRDEPLLAAAQMPYEGVMQLARRWVDEFLNETLSRSSGDPHVPDDLLATLPDSVRVFYAPR